MHAGPWGAAGTLIPVAINEGDTPSDIKRKLEHPTGIPVASQKLVLAAFSQIAVGDKRTAIKFGSCGVTEGFGLTLDVRRGAVRESTVLRRDIAIASRPAPLRLPLRAKSRTCPLRPRIAWTTTARGARATAIEVARV